MATPRVFVSSTCYDLKYIRENLKYFIRTIGYDPVLSDDGDVFYNPSSHTHDACLREVETCQLFVLIIGGRYGGTFREGSTSITNNEYRQAINHNIPVFALVEQAVYSDHHLFGTNKKDRPLIFREIKYPSCDNIKIFEFLDEVRKNTKNNSLFPFRDFSDIESYLKKQWAGMMFEFLDQRKNDNQSKITNRLLDDLAMATRKSEELIKVLLRSSPIDDPEASIQLVDIKIEAENFARLVLDKFKISKLEASSFEALQSIPLDVTWDKFLLATDDFYQEEILLDGETHIVLFGPSGFGLFLAVKGPEGVVNNPYNDTLLELEKAFDVFRNANLSTRDTVLKMLVHGIA